MRGRDSVGTHSAIAVKAAVTMVVTVVAYIAHLPHSEKQLFL